MTLVRLTIASVTLSILAAFPATAVDVLFEEHVAASLDAAEGVVAADLDGDGDDDLVSHSNNGGAAQGTWWYENVDGNGTFGPGTQISSTGNLYPFNPHRAVDMNGDGTLDVVELSWTGVGWYSNTDGAGTFGGETRITNGGFHNGYDVGDVDGDGDPDIVLATQNSENRVSWVENLGGGSFGSPNGNRQLIGAVSSPRDATFADFDGDGDLDVIGCNFTDIFWFENTDGAGTFGPLQTIFSQGSQNHFDINVADLDGDGDMDAYSSAWSSAALRWYDNTAGDGSSWTNAIVGPTGNGVISTAVVDMDLDGDPDLLTQSLSSDEVMWFENSAGDASAWIRHSISTGIDSFGVAVGDFDGDGDPDVLTSSKDGHKLSWFENRTIHRRARFDTATVIDGTLNSIRRVVAADLDRDGDLDAVAPVQLDQEVLWFENDGGPAWNWPERVVAAATTGSPASAAVADIDGDGDLDVALPAGSNTVEWFESDGAVPPMFTLRSFAVTPFGAEDVEAGDIDGDGDTDLILIESFSLWWYENDGASPPGWTERSIPDLVDNAREVALADLDGDGDLDAITGGLFTNSIAWYENDGASPPNWTARGISTASGILRLEQIDVDGDGDLDIVADAASDGAIYWYENGGGSPLSWTEHLVALLTSNQSVHAGDLDDDGDIDLVAGVQGNIPQPWYENDGASPPGWTKRSLPTIDATHGWDVEDVDGDGDLDLLAAQSFADAVVLIENVGGQFTMGNSNSGDGTAPEGEPVPLLATTLTLNGRAGDSPGELESLRLRFTDTGATPLTTGQLADLVDSLSVYRDDGSGEFEPGQDVEIVGGVVPSLAAGVQTIWLPGADPNTIFAAPATYLVVGQMTTDAASQAPNEMRVTHLSTSSLIEQVETAIGLEIEPVSDFASQDISAVGRFVVDVTTDGTDASPGDGTCDVGGGACTLRAAVQEANALAGDNHIFLPAGTYTLSIAGAGEAFSATGDLNIRNIADRTTIVGAGAGVTVIDAAGLDRVLDVFNSYVKLEGLTLTGGSEGAILIGGASSTVEIVSSELTGNSSSQSGGGVSHGAGTLILTGTSISDNSVAATRVGGGLFTSATVTMTGSTISGNSATNGGGIYSVGTVTITNSTISGNTATSAGGGIWLSSGPGAPDLTLEAVTIFGNDASASGGIESGGTVDIRNTIIAGNTAGLFPDCQGILNSLGHNLIEDTAACTINGVTTGNITGVPAELAALGDNGGPTLTHAFAAGSPAIDAGSCGGLTEDQRGDPRPTDLPGVANVDDGCDIGAYESRPGSTQPRIEIPVRWCGLRGAPSIENPTLVGETSVNDVLRKRHERASDNIYTPLANISFRSAGNVVAEDYPLIEDPDCVEDPPSVFTCSTGQRGEVLVDIEEANFEEFQQIIASCRAAWEELDPDIQGVTAVHINRFVDDTGSPLEILGIGGRAGESLEGEQAMAGRVMVVDNVYRLDVPANPEVPNPPDAIDRLLGHELGHALSLQHGDGVDNDSDGELDNDDDKTAGLPRFDGPNLMQYRNGTELTTAQVEQARNHMDDTLPDVDVQPLGDSVSAEEEIEPERRKILQFGYDGLTELSIEQIAQFAEDSVLEFERRKILQFERRKILQFERRKILQFEARRILQFGMDYSGSLPANKTRLRAATGSIPWPAAIRPTSRYFFYLDLDRNDATGAYPPQKANPELSGTNFPGQGNFTDEADLTSESGIDLIAQVELSSSCPSAVCTSTAELKVFDYNDGTGVYELVLTDPNPELAALGVELYLDNGGQSIADDNIPTELVVQPKIDNSILFAAGWGFDTPGGGGPAVPQRVRMEVVSTIECDGNVLNDDPTSAVVDCQCTDCAVCPDYPGCSGSTGTPRTLSGTTILADGKAGELTFEPPLLPSCVSIPQLAAEGAALTVAVTDLPDDVTGTVEVVVGATVVGTQPIAPVDGGSVNVAVLLPANVTGPVRLSLGVVGLAPRADCIVDVTPSLACADNDGDGDCDTIDTDDDNDGVTDGSDIDPLNPFRCGDGDVDGCDDCASGGFAPFQDGADYDLDGLCDVGDPDDDNDGVLDGSDGEPKNEFACGDSDADRCDDCVNGFPADPSGDGPDFDLDGQCDLGDPDDDNDGTTDAADCAPNDSSVARIPDGYNGLTLEADKVRVSWSTFHPEFGSATTVDLVRGELASLPVGSGAESCLLDGTLDTFYDDATPVPQGGGLWYLLRGENACGAGNFGEASDGGSRVPAACP